MANVSSAWLREFLHEGGLQEFCVRLCIDRRGACESRAGDDRSESCELQFLADRFVLREFVLQFGRKLGLIACAVGAYIHTCAKNQSKRSIDR